MTEMESTWVWMKTDHNRVVWSVSHLWLDVILVCVGANFVHLENRVDYASLYKTVDVN